MNDQIHQRLGALLDMVQVAMESADLWECDEPSEDALASQEPFAVDTLSFEQWLRYVFIHRFGLMVQHQLPLPTACSVAPMAEEVYRDQRGTQALIDALKAVDTLLTLEPQNIDVDDIV